MFTSAIMSILAFDSNTQSSPISRFFEVYQLDASPSPLMKHYDI